MVKKPSELLSRKIKRLKSRVQYAVIPQRTYLQSLEDAIIFFIVFVFKNGSIKNYKGNL